MMCVVEQSVSICLNKPAFPTRSVEEAIRLLYIGNKV